MVVRGLGSRMSIATASIGIASTEAGVSELYGHRQEELERFCQVLAAVPRASGIHHDGRRRR